METVKWERPHPAPRQRPVPKNRACSIDGCERRHLAKGLCGRHYERLARNGDPLTGRDLNDGPVKEGVAAKPCGKCGGPKPCGRGRIICDGCREIANLERADKESRRSRERDLLRKYGITVAVYEDILRQQNGGCAICGGQPTASFRCFDVDHDHVTGKVRGLLCRRCNTGLGYVEAGFHEQALAYLEGGVLSRQT